MPSLCPSCGRYLCDHTAEERGQTEDEMMRPMTAREERAWKRYPADSPEKIAVARELAHYSPKRAQTMAAKREKRKGETE